MAYLPIPSVTQTTQLISMVKSVVSAASATFADLLNSTTNFSRSSSDSSILSGQRIHGLSTSLNPRLALEIETEALLDDFHSTFVDDLRQLGIDISSGIELKFSELGTLEVAGDHPDKAAIEIALDGNPRYFEAVQKIAVNSILTGNSTGLTESGEFRLSVNSDRALTRFI